MKRLLKKSQLKKLAKWVQLDMDKTQAVPGYGVGDPNVRTWYQKGILTLDELEFAIGFSGENRDWHEDSEGNKYFGKYPEERWNEMVEEAKTTGIINPILLEIYPNGAMAIVEGNHRVELAKQAGLDQIPAEIYYMGGAEAEWKIEQ